MIDDPVVGLGAVVLLGMTAQWVAWRLHLPSILLLLVLGFLAGPVFGWLDPDELYGDLLLPLVALSAALILFEGGLSLSFRELRGHGPVVGRLVSVGVLVTWAGAAAGARYLLELDWGIAVLLGAILSVSGPTVVQPLLQHIRPRGAAEPILKWEGIVVDPIGATLAVLVVEVLGLARLHEAAPHALLGLLRTIGVAGFFGVGFARLLIELLRRYWIPDWLHNPFALAFVVVSFTASNVLQPDSGLLAVVLFGVVLANRVDVSVRHIVEFKENLRVLLLSAVFVLLAARIEIAALEKLDVGVFLFLGLLILVVRPLSVFVSTLGSSLEVRERIFLAWVFPRGIVAAAVASVFALELKGTAGADLLVPATFVVIVGTVLVYGLTAGPLARRLGLSVANPQGALIVGAHGWAREIALALQEAGIAVLVVDTNARSIARARLRGLPVWYGNALSEHAVEAIDFSLLGRLLAVTPNDEVNTLATLHYMHILGRDNVFQLASEPRSGGTRTGPLSTTLRGRILFGDEATYLDIGSRIARGGAVKATPLTDKFTYEDFLSHYGDRALVLFAVRDGRLRVASAHRPFTPQPNGTLIAIVENGKNGGSQTAK